MDDYVFSVLVKTREGDTPCLLTMGFHSYKCALLAKQTLCDTDAVFRVYGPFPLTREALEYMKENEILEELKK